MINRDQAFNERLLEATVSRIREAETRALGRVISVAGVANRSRKKDGNWSTV